MARVIYGGGVSEFIGSIGGSTYQSNGAGFIVRIKPKIARHRTNPQVIHIGSFVYLSQYYRCLSTSDKATWVYYANNYTFTDYWGRVKTLNALQWFILINTQYLFINAAIVDTPFTYRAPTPSAAFVVNYSATTLTIDTATIFNTSDYQIRLFVTAPLVSQSPVARRSLLTLSLFGNADVNSLNITSDWEALTGLNYVNDVYSTGSKVQVVVTCIDNQSFIPSEFTVGS